MVPSGPLNESLLLAIQEFTFCIKCVSHGCNNGTKWGLQLVASSKDVVDDGHICTASLNKCATAFHSHIDLFLLKYLEWDPKRSGSDEDIHAFWSALGVHPHMVAQLVQADLFWDGSRLRVHSSFQTVPEAFGNICDMVLHLLRWVDFSETRWCGSGIAGRSFFAAAAGGVDGIHAILLQDPHVSKEKMSGITRATPQVRLFLAVAALSADSTEVVGLELLEDDSFLRRARELFLMMEEELKYLHDLPDLVWERLATLISKDTRAIDFRDSCIFAAHIGSCYLWDDSFAQLSLSPLSITQGDIAQNLANFSLGMFDPLDTQAKQIKACLDICVPMSSLLSLGLCEMVLHPSILLSRGMQVLQSFSVSTSNCTSVCFVPARLSTRLVPCWSLHVFLARGLRRFRVSLHSWSCAVLIAILSVHSTACYQTGMWQQHWVVMCHMKGGVGNKGWTRGGSCSACCL